MSKRFSYSVLTYKHSQFLGEVLNIGVLFVFPEENTVEFHYPQSLVRLSGAYTDFNTHLIKDYLCSFEEKSREISNQLHHFDLRNNASLTNNFIIEDASALQFDPFRSGIYYHSVAEVREQYIALLLGHYTSDTVNTTHKLSEKAIIQQVKSNVLRLNPASRDRLRFDNRRILRSKHVAFKSDFYWRNTDVNYAKAVTFDLAVESKIIDKALLINGKLRQLEKTHYRNAQIDLIVQDAVDSKFTDAIAEAKSILSENQINPTLYFDLEVYSEQVATNIQAFHE